MTKEFNKTHSYRLVRLFVHDTKACCNSKQAVYKKN